MITQILIAILLFVLALILIASLLDAFLPFVFPKLTGDIDTSKYGKSRAGADLFGDNDDDDEDLSDELYDDEDDLAIAGDINAIVPAISLTGDADEEEDKLMAELDGLLAGSAKTLKSGRKVQPGDTNAYRRTKGLVKPVGPAKFKPGLVEKKMLVEVIKNKAKDPAARSQAVLAIKSLGKVIGGLTRFIELAPITVTGGKHTLTTTNLKIDGESLTEVYKYWRVNYPGLSITKRTTSSGGTASVTFGTPSAGQITKVLPLIITLAGAELVKIKSQFVSLSVTGTLVDTTSFSSTGDEVEVFTDDATKTTKIVIIPYKVVKQRLHPMCLAPVTTTAEITVTVTGLPDDVVMTVRAASEDDAEWLAYQQMIGLK